MRLPPPLSEKHLYKQADEKNDDDAFQKGDQGVPQEQDVIPR